MTSSTLFTAVAVTILAACNNPAGKTDKEADKMLPAAPAQEQAPSAAIYDKKWKLQYLNGKPIVLDTTFPKQPQLTFETKGRVSGDLGCNSFGGNAELLPNNGMKIAEIGATQMACPNLKIEQAFLEALRQTKAYRIDGNYLTLTDGEKDLAKLVLEAAK